MEDKENIIRIDAGEVMRWTPEQMEFMATVCEYIMKDKDSRNTSEEVGTLFTLRKYEGRGIVLTYKVMYD